MTAARALRAGRAARVVRAGVRAGLGALALPALLAAAPGPAPAIGPGPASGGGWSAAPAAGRPYVYLEGAAGSVLTDTLSVTNPTTAPLTVRLTGDAAPAPVTFAARTVTVPARTRADVPFTVTVGAGTPPGDHRGALRAEAAARTAAARTTVVPLHLRVSGPRLAALTVEDVRVDRSGTVRYTLVNRGTTTLAPRLAVRADGVLGTVLDRPERPLPLTLRPGERATRTEPWPDPPALDAVTVRLTAAAPGAPPATARAAASFASAPGIAAATAALLAGAGAVTYTAYALRRRKR
ncbi:hypothetical protein SLA_2790 [Streptomyces laurentii]|uniref:DUF916 domain-containing protein n=1 Tax=Streptomyces laurentii TaxID=39478 RepID=A0A169NGS0_STRLU|nr:hypothetical protein SLA_2790 [Streptomyces laurentii]